MRVHYGFRFIESDLLRIYESVHALRPVIFSLMNEKRTRWVARRCADILDRAHVAKIEPALAPDPEIDLTNLLLAVNQEMWDREAKVAAPYAKRDPALDMEFSVMAYPFEGRVYGLALTEQSEFQKILFESGLIESWQYWGNSDRPAEISEEEWEDRARVWRAIEARDKGWGGRMSACGLTFEFPIPALLVHADDVLDHLPTRETRARVMAHAVVHVQALNRIANDPGEPMDKAVAASNFVRSEKGQDEIRLWANGFLVTLAKITKEDLINPPVRTV